MDSELSTGALASGFNTLDELTSTRQRLTQRRQASTFFYGDEVPALLFHGAAEKVVLVPQDVAGTIDQWFIIGDVHGDYYALRNLVEQITWRCPDFRLVFLGDIVDRGLHPTECIAYILELAEKYPGRIAWIAGNHDVGVYFHEEKQCFLSTVVPSEFQAYLNREGEDRQARTKFGLDFIELVAGLPRALIFPDGLLVTHGGFPHTDLQKACAALPTPQEKRAWLNDPRCLEDFTWTRISGAKAKIPNRSSKGCEYGYADFASLCETLRDVIPVNRLVTGHDHPEGGFDEHPEWVLHPALTLTGFAFDHNCELEQAFSSGYLPYLVAGRMRVSERPEVLRIPVYANDLMAFHAAEVAPLFAVDAD